jgi:hypothetical protein
MLGRGAFDGRQSFSDDLEKIILLDDKIEKN